MAPPKSGYSNAQSDGFLAIATALRAAGSTLRANVEIGVVVDFDTVRVSDVVVRSREADTDNLMPPDAARLVVEIANQSLTKDLGLKARDYAATGIPEYWVVDIAARVIHLHRDHGPDGYATRTVAVFGAPIHAACLPEPIVFDG